MLTISSIKAKQYKTKHKKHILLSEKLEDKKWIIRSRKPKDRQYSGQKKNNKEKTRVYKTLHKKINDRTTRTPLKSFSEPMCSGRVSSSCSTNETRRVTVRRHEHYLIWKSYWTPVYVDKNKEHK